MTTLQFVDTPHLRVAYEVSGPADGEPMVLLHGWPDDIRTWDGVLPELHAQGWRTYVPYVRGFGPTRFLSAQAPRTGQLASLGQDVLEFADALGLQRLALVGHDWGARAAYIASSLAPERVKAMVSISVGWGTNNAGQALTLEQVHNFWYHWFMTVPRGEDCVRHDRHGLTGYIWKVWNPGWDVPAEMLAATAPSFDNPDWPDITLHSYRSRWGHAPLDPAYDAVEARLAADPMIRVPCLMLHGAIDPCTPPYSSEGKEHLFAERYERALVEGTGHFPQRQAPQDVARRVSRFMADYRLA